MLANGLVRLLFLVLLELSLTVHQFVWSPIWLIPIAIGVALNLKVAWRTPVYLLFAMLVLPAELWLLSRIWSTCVSWLNIWFSARRDGWAAEAAAESGKGGGSDVIGKMLATIIIGGAVITAGTWWWIEKAWTEVQQAGLTTGWSVVTVMTLVLTGFA